MKASLRGWVVEVGVAVLLLGGVAWASLELAAGPGPERVLQELETDLEAGAGEGIDRALDRLHDLKAEELSPEQERVALGLLERLLYRRLREGRPGDAPEAWLRGQRDEEGWQLHVEGMPEGLSRWCAGAIILATERREEVRISLSEGTRVRFTRETLLGKVTIPLRWGKAEGRVLMPGRGVSFRAPPPRDEEDPRPEPVPPEDRNAAPREAEAGPGSDPREEPREAVSPPVGPDPGLTPPSAPSDPRTPEPGRSVPGNTDPGSSEPGRSEPGSSEPGSADPGNSDPGNSELGPGG